MAFLVSSVYSFSFFFCVTIDGHRERSVGGSRRYSNTAAGSFVERSAVAERSRERK